MAIALTCPGCGMQLQAGGNEREKECPMCGARCVVPTAPPPAAELPIARRGGRRAPLPEAQPVIPVAARASSPAAERPAPAPKKKPAPAAAPPPKKKFAWDDDEDDGNPYQVAGGPERKCPECSALLTEDAQVCLRCGYNLATREKLKRTYQPLQKSWETGLAFSQRFLIFLTGQAIIAPMALYASWHEGSLLVGLIPWLVTSAILAFLCGTYERIELERNHRGKVNLRKVWRVCFLARKPLTIDVRGFEGIGTGMYDDVGTADWLVFLSLLLFLIVPGILWYFFVIARTTYFVALCKDHGYPDTMLYRGWSPDLMREIAATIKDATELPMVRE